MYNFVLIWGMKINFWFLIGQFGEIISHIEENWIFNGGFGSKKSRLLPTTFIEALLIFFKLVRSIFPNPLLESKDRKGEIVIVLSRWMNQSLQKLSSLSLYNPQSFYCSLPKKWKISTYAEAKVCESWFYFWSCATSI